VKEMFKILNDPWANESRSQMFKDLHAAGQPKSDFHTQRDVYNVLVEDTTGKTITNRSKRVQVEGIQTLKLVKPTDTMKFNCRKFYTFIA
jgi:hypothetical protein